VASASQASVELIIHQFGQNLPRNQVPEWARSYIDYKALKKLIKTARLQSETDGAEPDLAGMMLQRPHGLV
jgi:SPX domain protein involved in polyphosphate accumulation